jgi:hypothetical protein
VPEPVAAPAPAAAPDGMISVPPGMAVPPAISAPTVAPIVPPATFTPPPKPTIPLAAVTISAVDDAIDDETRVAPPRKSRAAWRLVLADGTAHVVSGKVVVGRQPVLSASTGAESVLKVADPDGLMSKSHAAFEVEKGALWVTDLGSTNGIVILNADGTELEIPPRGRSEVPEDAEVELATFVLTAKRGAK